VNKHLLTAVAFAELAGFTIILCCVGFQKPSTVTVIFKNSVNTVCLSVEFKLKFTEHHNISTQNSETLYCSYAIKYKQLSKKSFAVLNVFQNVTVVPSLKEWI